MILIGSRFGKIELPVATKKILTVNDAIGDLPDPDSNHKRPLHRIRQKFTDKVLKRIKIVNQDRYELPDNLVLECHKPRRYKLPMKIGLGKLGSLMGEAFPPPMAEAQASMIFEHLIKISA